MKKRLLFALLLLLTIFWLAVIFGFSDQSGTESGGLSRLIAEPVTNFLIRLSGELSADEQATLYMKVDGAVRIAAHFTEYAILGMLLTLLCQMIHLNWMWIPWVIGTLYAVTDEWHQSFSPGRTSDPRDVVIDSLGVLCGIVLTQLLKKIWREKHV